MIYQYYDKALLKLTEQNTLLGSLSKLGNDRLRTFQKILLATINTKNLSRC